MPWTRHAKTTLSRVGGQGLDDAGRLGAIAASDLLDSPAEDAFDRATRLASRLLDTPVALVSIVTDSRQFFKSQVGLPEPWATARETPLSHSFCQFVVKTGEAFIVSDSREHDLVADNLAVPDLDVVAYCGIPLEDGDGNILGSFCAIDHTPREWTEREIDTLRLIAGTVRSELLLREQARELQSTNEILRMLSKVASSTQNMVIITDGDGRTEWINQAFEDFTGYTLADLAGRRPGEVLQGPDTDPETVRMMAIATSQGEGFNAEVLNYRRSGEPYWIAIDVQPVVDDQGVVTNYVAVQSDVTQRRADESELLSAKEFAEETARTKATFLASMSHEIRTPLNAVIGLTGMLLDTDLDDRQRGYVETARKSGELLLELLHNVLDFSALESHKVELEARRVDLRELVSDTCDLFTEQARGRQLTLSHRVSADVPERVVADPTRLRQVLVNLLGNAIKFTRDGGVTLTADLLHRDADAVDVRLSVTDTGIGVPADRLHRLFQPFSQVDASTTRKYGGTGLGLAISNRLVNLMGSELEITSEFGTGSSFAFTLRLPVPDDDADAEAGSKPTPDIQAELRILLAEDDPINQIVAVHMLEKMGHAVDIAENGRRVIERLEAGKSYDVVLMDVHMPGMDGIEATRIIRETWQDSERPRIIAMTANALEGDRERFLAAGMDDYVSKPVSAPLLAQALGKIPIRQA